MMNFAKIMKQANQMKGKVEKIQKELETLVVEGASGGNMVSVSMTAKGVVKSITVDPSLINVDDKDMLEDLIVAAMNNATENATALKAEKMKEVTGGLDIPGLELPF